MNFNLFSKGHQPEAQAPTTESANTAATTEPAANAAENATAEAKSATKRVFNLIVLDESGSMHSIYQPALTGVNETLQTIRDAKIENDNQEHFVTLVTFDTGHYNEIYRCTPAEQAVDITSEQYRPNGGTPLYDAMGRAITELRGSVSPDDVVLVTIITDGYENASRQYTGKAIKDLVETMRKQNWVFTYIGANQDVEAVAESMSINNRLAFDANEESTRDMFAKEACSRKAFFSKLKHPDSVDFSEDYFL